MKFLSCIATLLLFISAARAAESEGPVILTELGVKNLGLETVVVEEADFERTTFALGRTEALPEKRSVLSSRIPGRVVESRLKLGAYVAKGEKLVLLEGRQPGEPPPTVWLTAPADGTIIAVNTSLGAPVEATDTLAELADLSTLYLIATLPQAVAGKVGKGTEARVHFPLRPDRNYTAKLLDYAACPCPDPACALGQTLTSRPGGAEEGDRSTAGVIFTLENPDNQLRPGMNAECSIVLEKRPDVLSIPRQAVQGRPTNRHVYTRHPTISNAFDRVAVPTGMTGGDRVEIIEGLYPGDEVVTRGSYSLGFAGGGGGPSLKEAMDAAHGHDHNEDGSEKAAGASPEAASTSPNASGHAHGGSAGGGREIFFMSATAILALLLVLTSLRRGGVNAKSEGR